MEKKAQNAIIAARFEDLSSPNFLTVATGMASAGFCCCAASTRASRLLRSMVECCPPEGWECTSERIAGVRGHIADWGVVPTYGVFDAFDPFCAAEGLPPGRIADAFRNEPAA